MTYQPNIPLPQDLISVSQNDLNVNFTSINSAFNVNHVSFNDAGAGKHKFVSAIDQASDPATLANELALYSKALGGISTLYLRKENNGTVVQMSGVDPTLAVIGGTTQGTTFLPGGLIMNFGLVNCVVGANPAKTFATAFPSATLAITLSCQNTLQSQTATCVASQTDVTIYSSAIQPVFYIAIGH